MAFFWLLFSNVVPEAKLESFARQYPPTNVAITSQLQVLQLNHEFAYRTNSKLKNCLGIKRDSALHMHKRGATISPLSILAMLIISLLFGGGGGEMRGDFSS